MSSDHDQLAWRAVRPLRPHIGYVIRPLRDLDRLDLARSNRERMLTVHLAALRAQLQEMTTPGLEAVNAVQ